MSDCLYNYQQEQNLVNAARDYVMGGIDAAIDILNVDIPNNINQHIDMKTQEIKDEILIQCVDANNQQNNYIAQLKNELVDYIQNQKIELDNRIINARDTILADILDLSNLTHNVWDESVHIREVVDEFNLDLTEVIENLLWIKENIGEDPESKTVQEKLIDSLVKIGEIKITLDNVNIGVNGNSFKLIEINQKSDDIKGKLDDTVDVSGAITTGYISGSQLSGNYADDEISSLVAEYETLEEPLPVPVNPGLPVPVPPEKALVVIAYSLGLIMSMQAKDLGISLIDMVQNRSHNTRHKKFNNESYLPWLFFKALGLNKDEHTENILQILPWGTDSIMMRRLKEGGLNEYFKTEGGKIKWNKAIPFECQTGQTEYLTDVFSQSLALWPAWRV